ncbi:MAG: cation diffusion facilitator family transporter [Pseudomonadota bacterium]
MPMTKNVRDHYRKIRRVLAGILVLNWLVAGLKIFYGLFTNCASITADGLHSLSDGTSNIIGLIGIHFACQPKDVSHPYGHRKYETFFSLGIAVVLFVVAFNLVKQGISRINTPVYPLVNLNSFLIMLGTLGVNLFVVKYERGKAAALHSDILMSDAMHTKADVFTSLSVIISLILIKLGYTILDPIATIIIALFIVHAGYDIIKHSSRVLCDTAAIFDVKKIVDIVLGVEGARTCHKIRTRGGADDIHVDLHVQVDPQMHISEAHKISYEIETEIKKRIPEVTDVVVHIEPKEKLNAF